MDTSLAPGSVLVGVDGSLANDSALAWAAAYAQSQRRPLALVHAAGVPVVTDFAIDLTEARANLKRDGRAVTERALGLVRANHPDLPVSTHVVLGDPRAVLTEVAVDAAVLVLGSRGRGPVASLLLGSVSVALTGHAPCPVVVARPRSDVVANVDLSVVVGVDGDEDAAEALTFGFELASSQFRTLEVVHALGAAWSFPYPDMVTPGLVRVAVESSEERLVDLLAEYVEKFPDVVVHRRMVHQSAAQALIAASGSAAAVVMGCRGGRTARSRLASSVSRSVVENAHSTVVVMRGPAT